MPVATVRFGVIYQRAAAAQHRLQRLTQPAAKSDQPEIPPPGRSWPVESVFICPVNVVQKRPAVSTGLFELVNKRDIHLISYIRNSPQLEIKSQRHGIKILQQ